MVLVDLAEADRLCRRHPLWSARRPAPVWLRRSDFMGDPDRPLDESVRDLVAARTGTRPAGPVALLTNPLLWGHSFNPISCYFCFDADGRQVRAMVAEVTNTPWLERHCYVVGPPGHHVLDKALHVSPFLGMDLVYALDYGAPGPGFAMTLAVEGNDGPVLHASVALRRRQADRAALGQLARHPGRGGPGVTLGIYRRALGLWRGGAPYHRHPPPPGPGVVDPRRAPGGRGG